MNLALVKEAEKEPDLQPLLRLAPQGPSFMPTLSHWLLLGTVQQIWQAQ